jgi:hypothetical protein
MTKEQHYYFKFYLLYTMRTLMSRLFGKKTRKAMFTRIKKTYRHQTNKDQIKFVKDTIAQQFEEVSKSINKYLELQMPPLPEKFDRSDFDDETPLNRKLKTVGQALYSTYLTQSDFRFLYSTQYQPSSITRPTPMYINRRHYPFIMPMMEELRLAACPLFGYLDLRTFPQEISPKDVIMVYLDVGVKYLCDHNRVLIYIPQYSYVCKSKKTGRFKLSHNRPEGWEVYKSFGDFDDSAVRVPPQSLRRDQLGDRNATYESHQALDEIFSTGLLPDYLNFEQYGGVNSPLRYEMKFDAIKQGMFGVNRLTDYKRISYKLYWLSAMLKLCEFSLLQLYLAQGVYIRTLGYGTPGDKWNTIFNDICHPNHFETSKFEGYITSNQLQTLTETLADEPTRNRLVALISNLWKGFVDSFKSGDSSFKSLMVFLSRKYPSKTYDTHSVTSDNIMYATYNQELLKRVGNKLLHIARSFRTITPEERTLTLGDFEYVDYSITLEINGTPRVFNALQYLANMVAYELGGNESYIIQPFLAVQNGKLIPMLTTDQIHAMIEGKEGYKEQLARHINTLASATTGAFNLATGAYDAAKGFLPTATAAAKGFLPTATAAYDAANAAAKGVYGHAKGAIDNALTRRKPKSPGKPKSPTPKSPEKSNSSKKKDESEDEGFLRRMRRVLDEMHGHAS